MPRARRTAFAGTIFHVVNRGVERRQLFFEESDYKHFLALLREGKQRAPVKVYGFCTMRNHFHALLEPETDEALAQYMHWVTGQYALNLRANTNTRGLGHVFQQRYWSGPADGVDHFFVLLRYVEANARRACLVDRAEDWRWGSLFSRRVGDVSILDQPPYDLPENWPAVVNAPQFDRELALARFKPKRGRPCTFS
jgi:putative transposase